MFAEEVIGKVLKELVEKAQQVLRQRGYQIKQFGLPHTGDSFRVKFPPNQLSADNRSTIKKRVCR
jgi:hypothetical protein